MNATDAETARRLAIARRVAQAHEAAADAASMVALVSGSTVDGSCDARSDVDMSVLWPVLPEESALRMACNRAGGQPWHWSQGALADGALVVAFVVDGIETQIGYATLACQEHELDDVLVRHLPDTPNHKLAEGLLKALPLAGAAVLERWQARLADFPEPLARAMAEHALVKTPTPWRAVEQILHRDAALWCRDLLVDAGYRLLLALAGANRRYFTRFQVKRMRRFVDGLSQAPEHFADRLEALLLAPPDEAFAQLHALEGDVLELVAQQWPGLELAPLRARREAFAAALHPRRAAP
jgi:hypothetical protein